jgi:hypothetical protein
VTVSISNAAWMKTKNPTWSERSNSRIALSTQMRGGEPFTASLADIVA